jgi:hypothetical protein
MFPGVNARLGHGAHHSFPSGAEVGAIPPLPLRTCVASSSIAYLFHIIVYAFYIAKIICQSFRLQVPITALFYVSPCHKYEIYVNITLLPLLSPSSLMNSKKDR